MVCDQCRVIIPKASPKYIFPRFQTQNHSKVHSKHKQHPALNYLSGNISQHNATGINNCIHACCQCSANYNQICVSHYYCMFGYFWRLACRRKCIIRAVHAHDVASTQLKCKKIVLMVFSSHSIYATCLMCIRIIHLYSAIIVIAKNVIFGTLRHTNGIVRKLHKIRMTKTQ